MNILFLAGLAARRLRSRLGLNLLSLLGVAFAIGLVSGIPIFAQGVSFRVLREELADMGFTARRPPFAVRLQYLSSADRPLSCALSREVGQLIVRQLREKLGLPITAVYTQVDSPTLVLRPAADDLRFGGRADVDLKRVTISAAEGMEAHIRVVDGAPYGQAPAGERLAVWVHELLCNEIGLNMGDALDLVHPYTGQVIPISIAGVWRARDLNDRFWYYDPDHIWRHCLLVTPAVYEAQLQPQFDQQTGYNYWYVIMDENALAPERAGDYLQGLEGIANDLSTRLRGASLDYSPLEPLRRYLKRKETLSMFLTSFSLPALGLILYFFSSLSTVITLFQREEMAILASRGAGRSFMMGLAVLETALLVALGVPLGLFLGGGLARLMGFSQSFLAFVPRSPIPVSVRAVDWRLLAGAAGMLLVARLVPILGATRAGVVVHLRERSRQVARGGLLKLAVDVPLVLATAYGYRQLSQRGTLAVVEWDPLGRPFGDPLLLLAPSLFVFTASLLAVHLFPLLMRPLDALSAIPGRFAAYMGLRQLARQGRQYATPLFLIIICLSLGGFYASTALSLDRWLVDRIYYQVGADLTIGQGTGGGQGGPDEERPAGGDGGWLLPASDYLEIPGVIGAIRVARLQASPQVENVRRLGYVIGVDRLEFPQVAFFRRDLARLPLGELMNRLGMYDDGLLVSRQFLTIHRLSEGQPLVLSVQMGGMSQSVNYRIVGTYDYFPTVYTRDREAFVCNLEYLFQQMGGLLPHEVWLRTAPEADHQEIVLAVEAKGVAIASLADAQPLLEEDQVRLERVGLFGVLSIGFLAGAILSCVGLLVYTYASLQGRLQQYSVLRAIGVQVRQVLAMVAWEYAGVVGYGLVAGALLGIVASHLYVPFFQFTSDAARAVPPFAPLVAWTQIGWIAGAFALALVASQMVMLHGASRRNLSLLLRMGQRE